MYEPLDMLSLPDDVVAACIRLAFAMLAGVVLGLNRDLKDKPAGVRTHGLVALGSALVTLVSTQLAYGAAGGADGNPVTRTIQGIIAGIGFLGAGVIIKVTDKAVVRGLTTAATIWLAACLGIAAGLGFIALTAITIALTLLLLFFGGPFERLMRRLLPSRRNDAALAHERAHERARRRRHREDAREMSEDEDESTALDDGAMSAGTPPGVS